ncbi:MAG: L-threonylcarbamoyladenylate synthase [Hyphomonas sp.]
MTSPVVPLDARTIVRAAEILQQGGLVAIPTETVYGLAGDAASPEAVARIYAAKGRPRFNPLIAHVDCLEMAAREAEMSGLAREAAEAFWPGPLTLVLPVRQGGSVCDLARAGLDTVALRLPAHKGARALIGTCGRPLVAPSANRSGHISPTRAEHVAADLGERINLILDGGPSEVGIESTILGFDGETPVLLRPGGIASGVIAERLGRPLRLHGERDTINAPGQIRSHYAPKAQLRLNAAAPEEGEGYLAFGPGAPGGLNLSPSGDLLEAATNLFAMLRALDARAVRIAVAPIPSAGLGEAINDRLARAAHRDP